MDIKELDKRQLILLTLLITFVVSLATGIVTVSLMNQMPKSVPQTINNVIQRTIEKVTTVQAPSSETANSLTENSAPIKGNGLSLLGNSDALVSIYLKNITVPTTEIVPPTSTAETTGGDKTNDKSGEIAIGQGVIVSDVGLILVDSTLIKDTESYKVILDKTDFDVSVLKRFGNGFTILKISTVKEVTPVSTDKKN